MLVLCYVLLYAMCYGMCYTTTTTTLDTTYIDLLVLHSLQASATRSLPAADSSDEEAAAAQVLCYAMCYATC